MFIQKMHDLCITKDNKNKAELQEAVDTIKRMDKEMTDMTKTVNEIEKGLNERFIKINNKLVY